jgi:fermentation-respiration switch protein FrsA (DUF1100 family)
MKHFNTEWPITRAGLTRTIIPPFKRIWAALVFPPILLSSSLYGFHWFEYAITFQPHPYVQGEWTPPNNAEEVTFLNGQNQRLAGWFLRSSSGNSHAVVIFFHGQGGNINNVGFIGEALVRRGFDVLLFDYRGYGKSEGQITCERDMYEDADAAYDYAVNVRGVAPAQVVLYGHSLGTAAVVDLASRRACGAIILESGFTSASAMASVRLPWLPGFMHSLGRNRFESAAKLRKVSCPVLVAHGDPDGIVPTQQGRSLFRAANEPKKLIVVPGAGHGVAGFGGDRYFNKLHDFISDSLNGGLARTSTSEVLTAGL